MADGAPPDSARIADIVRDEWAPVVARLTARFGDLGAAEDATQDATEHALTEWPTSGLPRDPRAWLIVVARRRLIDRIRRNAVGREKTRLAARLDRTMFEPDDPFEDHHDESTMRDDQLRLIFACCHPALSREAQVALTLRSVGGLTSRQIASAFLLPDATIAQRLVRAKRKIEAAGIPFTIPPDAELLARTDLVRTVLYLIFNEGYDASTGPHQIRDDLCTEAIRLAELLAELTPDDPESLALLALFLLIHSRRDARVDGAELVLLADQDRGRWDRDMITRGLDTLDRALRRERAGPIQIQAAINALHAEAASAADTDWPQIVSLYRRLLDLAPSPVTELNHAVAVAMADGPAAGLALLDETDLVDLLDDYTHFHAARAQLLSELGDARSAVRAYERALETVGNDVERRFLEQRLDDLSDLA